MTGSAPSSEGHGGGGGAPSDDGNVVDASSSSSPSPSSHPLSTTPLIAAASPRTSRSPPRPSPPIEDGTKKYRALVLDAGPIIRRTGYSLMRDAARSYYTVPGVIEEIRDAKSREHFDSLPFDVTVRTPSKEGCRAICDFARSTGDYRSLSSTDVQVMGLLYDLELEGCDGNVDHVRRTPKRTLGVGRIESLGRGGGGDGPEVGAGAEADGDEGEGFASSGPTAEGAAAPPSGGSDENGAARRSSSPPAAAAAAAARPFATKATKTWAALANPSASSSSSSLPIPRAEPPAAADEGEGGGAPASCGGENEADRPPLDATSSHGASSVGGGVSTRKVSFAAEELGGQFSDAEEEDDDDEAGGDGIVMGRFRYDDDDGEEYADPDREIGDEECDVYVLDPEEAEERKRRSASAKAERGEAAGGTSAGAGGPRDGRREEELRSDFPSLAAASSVPYGGSDDDDDSGRTGSGGDGEKEGRVTAAVKAKERQARLSSKSLEPRAARAGKSYDSFRNYRDVVKPKGLKPRPGRTDPKEEVGTTTTSIKDRMPNVATAADDDVGNEDRPSGSNGRPSRIVGGTAVSGQAATVDDDDGEGWIASVEDLRERRAFGTLDPSSRGSSSAAAANGKKDESDERGRGDGAAGGGPPPDRRAACATTDFAMQNVILQMNLRLFSVDGRRVRRLKTWVTRCGACYAVYANDDDDGKTAGGKTNARLFCDRCGSDALQRVAASLDKETGRLRLHLKKNYQHNLRGTKFNLPKPGKGNRFEGDLLLREDQLLVGAWNQKVKRRSGRGEAASLFGSDVASNVGCHADLTKRDDIRVGFGRRNPNATKYGRERRGKKKRGSENKACGLRRY